MKKIILISICSLVLLSCHKTPIKNDNIIYIEYQPPIIINSADSTWTLFNPSGGSCSVPIPTDTSITLNLDINNDSIDDFTLTYSNSYNFVSASSPCANYNSFMMLSGTSNNNMIAVSTLFPYSEPATINLNDTINNIVLWEQTSNLVVKSAGAPFSTGFSGNKYIGLKIIDGIENYYGWLYISKNNFRLTIISHAVNMTSNSTIKSGQKS